MPWRQKYVEEFDTSLPFYSTLKCLLTLEESLRERSPMFSMAKYIDTACKMLQTIKCSLGTPLIRASMINVFKHIWSLFLYFELARSIIRRSNCWSCLFEEARDPRNAKAQIRVFSKVLALEESLDKRSSRVFHGQIHTQLTNAPRNVASNTMNKRFRWKNASWTFEHFSNLMKHRPP